MSAHLAIAVALARKIEAVAPRFGLHVALTGGCLYKDGERKDIDLLFYPHENDATNTNRDGLLAALRDELGFVLGNDYGRVAKAAFGSVPVDLIFPGLGFNTSYSDSTVVEDGRLIFESTQL